MITRMAADTRIRRSSRSPAHLGVTEDVPGLGMYCRKILRISFNDSTLINLDSGQLKDCITRKKECLIDLRFDDEDFYYQVNDIQDRQAKLTFINFRISSDSIQYFFLFEFNTNKRVLKMVKTKVSHDLLQTVSPRQHLNLLKLIQTVPIARSVFVNIIAHGRLWFINDPNSDTNKLFFN